MMSTGSIVSDRRADQKPIERRRPTVRELRDALIIYYHCPATGAGWLDLPQWLRVMRECPRPRRIKFCTVALSGVDLSKAPELALTMAMRVTDNCLPITDMRRAYAWFAESLATRGAA